MRICDDLRQAVLQAAIQGKLTKQLPEDGNSKDLLKQIKNEKERLIKEKKIVPKKPTAPFFEAEDGDLEVLNIPNNWTFAQLSEVSLIQEGAGIRKWQYREMGTQLLCVTNILDGAVDLSKKHLYISTEEYESKYVHLTLNIGDIVCSCSGGSWGKSAIYDKPDIVMLNTSTLRLRFFGDLADNLYLYYLTKSEWFKKQLRKQLSGMQPNFGYAHYSRIIIPLPPLAEQQRIVARVDELMARIDDLEKTETELEKLKTAFPGDMKAALLQAAMQGKLTEQLPEDGNAADLLKQIIKEKTLLIKEGKIKKEKPLPEITPDEVPFDIPENWVFIRLGVAISLLSGQDLPASEYNNNGKGIVYLTGASNIDDNGSLIINRWTETPRAIAHKGDLLLSCKGTIGKTCILTLDKVHIARQFMALSTIDVLVDFIKYFLFSYIDELHRKAKSMIPGIERNNVLTAVIPLPPLAEQKRIVEKLDKLLPLCDGLIEK